MTETLAQRFEGMPYVHGLGLRVEAADRERVRVRVPFAEHNANPGGALHGGVGASVIDVAGAVAAWAGGGTASDVDGRLLDMSVAYLAAAIAEDVVGDARVLRRGKEIVYVEVDVGTDAGKPIARGLVTYRVGSPGRPAHQRPAAPVAEPAEGTVPSFARFFTTAPFMARLGLVVRSAHEGHAVVCLPWRGENAAEDGTVHDGAVAALVDTAAAMASWSLVALDARNKASTVGLHVTCLDRAPRAELVADARTLARNDEIFANAVTVLAAGRPIAAATVTYRIVVP